MTPLNFPLFVDENIGADVVEGLRAKRFDAPLLRKGSLADRTLRFSSVQPVRDESSSPTTSASAAPLLPRELRSSELSI